MAGQLIILGSGTSQGVPVIGCDCEVCKSKNPLDQRFRASVYVNLNGHAIQVDCGPDFRQQFLSNNLHHIDLLLLTHEHQDHIAGMDDLRPLIFRQKKGVRVLATERVQNRLKEMYSYAFEEIKYPGAPSFDLEEMPRVIGLDDQTHIVPIKVTHGLWPVLGFRFGKVVYLTDCKGVEPGEEVKFKGADTLIVSGLRHKTHHSHFSLDEAIEFGKQHAFNRIIITHISHDLGLHEEVSKNLPEGVELAYDGQVIDL